MDSFDEWVIALGEAVFAEDKANEVLESAKKSAQIASKRVIDLQATLLNMSRCVDRVRRAK